MQTVSLELERQVLERTEALEAAYRQLAKQESDLRRLQAEYRTLCEQLAAERQRSETLIALSNRFGAR